jgi:hypothetical protein
MLKRRISVDEDFVYNFTVLEENCWFIIQYISTILLLLRFSYYYFRFEIIYKEMAALIRNIIQKLKNKLDTYLYNNQISPFLDLAERKIHLHRSIIALGMLLSFLFAYWIALFA